MGAVGGLNYGHSARYRIGYRFTESKALIQGVALTLCPRALLTYRRFSNHVVPLMV